MKLSRIVLLIACSLPLSCHRSVPLHGYTFSYLTTHETKGSYSKTPLRTESGKVMVSGDFARVEMEEADELFPPHTVLLTKDGGKNLVIVQTDAKTYREMTLDQLTSIMRKKLESRMSGASIQFEAPEVRLEKAGGDRDIDTYPTQKFILRIHYSMSATAKGRHMLLPVNTTVRIWTTDLIPEKYFRFFMLLQLRSGYNELDEPMISTAQQITGFPLVEELATDVTVGPVVQHSNSRTRISDVKEATIESSIFETPKGYEKKDAESL